MNILNDTEHRLFLSAMQREKKICEQFDNSGDSGIKLLPICRSIERKVDKAIDIIDLIYNANAESEEYIWE